MACIHPKAACKWYDLMLTDIDKSLKIERDIQQFMSECIIPFIANEGYQGQAVRRCLLLI